MMRLTGDHIAYWRAKKSPEPKWFGQVRGANPTHVPSIHRLINQHVGKDDRDKDYVASNTLAILRSARKRGAMMQFLTDMSVRPGTVNRPNRRAAYCRKWLRRIEMRRGV